MKDTTTFASAIQQVTSIWLKLQRQRSYKPRIHQIIYSELSSEVSCLRETHFFSALIEIIWTFYKFL